MMEEDYVGREMQREELTKQMQSLLEQMANFKDNYKEELELFFEELEVEERLGNVQEEKKKIESKLTAGDKQRLELMQKIRENAELVSKLQKQMETNEEGVKSALSKDESVLFALEQRLQKKLDEIGNESLSKIVLEEVQKKNFCYGKAVFMIQKKLVETELGKLMVPSLLQQ